MTALAKQKLLETVNYQRSEAVKEAIKNASDLKTLSERNPKLGLGIDIKTVLSPTELKDLEDSHKYLRLSLKDKGCNGQSYDLQIVKDKDPRDFLITISENKNDPKLLIYHKAELFLTGSEMDYEDSRLNSGFVFKNPQVDGACGCGTSFNFDLSLVQGNAAHK